MKGSLSDMEELCAADPLVRTFRELVRFPTQSDDSSEKIPQPRDSCAWARIWSRSAASWASRLCRMRRALLR